MLIELQIQNESEFPLMRECVNDVREIWSACGEPETVDGPSTNIHGFKPHVDCAGDGPAEGETVLYNGLIDDLYALIDYRHIGSGIWYTQYHTNDERHQFETSAKEVIDIYVENYLWDEFCSSTLWEEQE